MKGKEDGENLSSLVRFLLIIQKVLRILEKTLVNWLQKFWDDLDS